MTHSVQNSQPWPYNIGGSTREASDKRPKKNPGKQIGDSFPTGKQTFFAGYPDHVRLQQKNGVCARAVAVGGDEKYSVSYSSRNDSAAEMSLNTFEYKIRSTKFTTAVHTATVVVQQ